MNQEPEFPKGNPTNLFVGGWQEVFVSGEFLSNPVSLIIGIPVAWVVYAVIVMIPMRMIDFNRKVNRHGSVLLALGVPFVIPEIVAIVCVVALVQLGAPIA
ncbi:MAG: hypothetical protein M1151_06725 [Candidatus Thermoplasmatota archaeon]|nr:hypothetical protein [Candidatus Thermoplasmatota archaeon]